MLIQRKEVTWSSDRCHPGLLGQALLAERKYIYPTPAVQQAPVKCWAHTEYFHWEILGDPEETSLAGGMWHSPPMMARVWGPGIQWERCLQFCVFPCAGEELILSWTGRPTWSPLLALWLPFPLDTLEDWTEPVRKRFPGAGQQKAWVLILVSDSQRALGDAAGPGWAAPPATTTRIQASARRPHQIRIKDGQHVSCGPL